MYDAVLPAGTRAVFERLTQSGVLGSAYLAGGTNIALQLGHRISRDLDFFITQKFDERILSQRLEEQGFTPESIEWQTIDGFFDEVKFSYFFYPYPLLFEPIMYGVVPLADLRDVAAMKVEAIASRGTRRDFIDMFVMVREKGWQMTDLFAWYQKKYGGTRNTILHALKSLAYFDDADADETPLVLLRPIDWTEVKKYFQDVVNQYAQDAFRE